MESTRFQPPEGKQEVASPLPLTSTPAMPQEQQQPPQQQQQGKQQPEQQQQLEPSTTVANANTEVTATLPLTTAIATPVLTVLNKNSDSSTSAATAITEAKTSPSKALSVSNKLAIATPVLTVLNQSDTSTSAAMAITEAEPSPSKVAAASKKSKAKAKALLNYAARAAALSRIIRVDASLMVPSAKDSDIHVQAAHVQRLQYALKRGQELPRNWFQCEWIERFSVTTNATTGERTVSCGVIDDVVLFDWIRKFAFPNLTPTQYRSTVRRNIVSQGPGYVAAPLAPDVRKTLTARIEEMGKKNWGFQVVLGNRKKQAQADLSDAAATQKLIEGVAVDAAASSSASSAATAATAPVSSKARPRKRKQSVGGVEKSAKWTAASSSIKRVVMSAGQGGVKLVDPRMEATASAWSSGQPSASLSATMTSLPMGMSSLPVSMTSLPMAMSSLPMAMTSLSMPMTMTSLPMQFMSVPNNSGLAAGSPPQALSMFLPSTPGVPQQQQQQQQYQHVQPILPPSGYQHQQQLQQQQLHQQQLHQQQLHLQQQQAHHHQQQQAHHHQQQLQQQQQQQQLQYQFHPAQPGAMWSVVNGAGEAPRQNASTTVNPGYPMPPPPQQQQQQQYYNFQQSGATPGAGQVMMPIDPRMMQQQQHFPGNVVNGGVVTSMSMSDNPTSSTTTPPRL